MARTMTTATPADPSAPPVRGWWAAFRDAPLALRLTTYAVGVLVLLLVAVAVTVVTLARRPLPQVDGRADLPGLEGEVEVVRDEHGIPQLYGDSMEDLVRAQGYVHAQERFFEMDVRRHATAGRLAELFGEAGLETDRFVRTMGWRRVAERELALVSPETRAVLEAYAEGVNAYLDQRTPTEVAVEYTVLAAGGRGYHPEEWTPVDSLAWLKAMAWDLRGNMVEEIDRVLASAQVGEERMRELYPPYPFREHPPIVTDPAELAGAAAQAGVARPAYDAAQRRALRRVRDGLRAMPELLGRGDGIGSNSWVVDGDHSSTGAPLLANDPHLGVSMPGIWMQMGLHCRELSEACPLDVAGFGFSGVPGIVIGHNSHIAWGFTNLGPDVTDLYLERVRESEWRYGGRWRPLRVRTETIEVAGGDDVRLTVRETRHGPILSDVSEELTAVGRQAGIGRGEEYAVSLAWTALRPAPTADAILGLNLATDWESFRAAAASFAVPSQNLVYADRAGHIGYQAPGLVPIRRPGHDGTVPAEGWRPAHDWTGDFVPFESLPSVLDPEEGFVVTANQAVVGPSYPFHLTRDWDRGYRAARIRDLLTDEIRGDGLSVDDMTRIQVDDHHPMGPVLTPYLLQVRLERGYWAGGQALLRDWDFRQSADSGAAAYFNVVWRNLLALTFRDELSEDLWPEGGQRWFAVVSRLLEEPGSQWWDDVSTEDVVERRDDILERALRDARDELTRRQARNPAGWTWGHLHRLELRSSTLGESGIAPVERLVNRGGWEVGGGSSTVDASSWNAADDSYTITSAPSMRMVVSLADLDESRWINLTGVSGHPFSEHYADQTHLWARGDTLPWRFTREAVDDAVEHRLTLVPAPTD